MAADSERKKFSVSHPGAKEYLIVGGVALAGALVWMWWKNRSSTPAAPASSGSGGTSPASPTGLSSHDLKIWITDHASSPKKHKKPPAKSPVSPAK